MKRFNRVLRAGLLGLLLLLAIVAVAGSVYDRTVVTLTTTAGGATWTNRMDYAALVLKRVWVENALAATQGVTFVRVTSDNAYTQTCGYVGCSGNAGSTTSFTAGYLKGSDKLVFTSFPATGGTVIVEYEVQQH